MDISVRADLHGWKFIFLTNVKCELPESYKHIESDNTCGILNPCSCLGSASQISFGLQPYSFREYSLKSPRFQSTLVMKKGSIPTASFSITQEPGHNNQCFARSREKGSGWTSCCILSCNSASHLTVKENGNCSAQQDCAYEMSFEIILLK
ncbi:uncharacterized protein [Euphorbia lathyris]|uniref:uncharacterized protein isoform X2 n=1 Tax=Euphorbia lathyris TaxID=212925 RepID=UPI00331382EF